MSISQIIQFCVENVILSSWGQVMKAISFSNNVFHSILSERKRTKPIWSTRISEENNFEHQNSEFMTVSSLPKTDHQTTPIVKFLPNNQHFTLNEEKNSQKFNFDNSSANPEKGNLSKSNRIDNVVNEVLIDKRPKFERQESITSGFEIEMGLPFFKKVPQ